MMQLNELDIASLPRDKMVALVVAMLTRLLAEPDEQPAVEPASTVLLDAKQIADKLGVPESWVRTEARAGRIPFIAIGKYVRFDMAAVRAALKETQALLTTASASVINGRGGNGHEENHAASKKPRRRRVGASGRFSQECQEGGEGTRERDTRRKAEGQPGE